MSTKVTGHETNPANASLTIEADAPSHGNASHLYVVSTIPGGNTIPDHIGSIKFQDGPVNADGNGVNGMTNEALLAIVRHRLEGFQSGPYACNENALALTNIEVALDHLHSRTRAREARGVEGTHAV